VERGETGARRHGSMVTHSNSQVKGRQVWKGRQDQYMLAQQCGKVFEVTGRWAMGVERGARQVRVSMAVW
jgi:hypothetical protein